VLADKGFLVLHLLPDGVTLVTPPLALADQFSARQVAETRVIAQARGHIERVNERLKNWKILSQIETCHLAYASDIIQVAAILTNLETPIFRSMTAQYSALCKKPVKIFQ
jgi:RNA polymerase-interacting CarD/CdnL/TRCF family regulator